MIDEIKPIPCQNVQEKTVREWFAKLDEELNEVKEAVLACYYLDDDIEAVGEGDINEKTQIALECADVITAVTSLQEALGIDAGRREICQAIVNQKNYERGRL